MKSLKIDTIFFFVALFALVFSIIMACVTPVAAQSADNCGPHENIVAFLGEKYGESRVSYGLAANDTLMEVFASPETGTWTVMATTAAGHTCLIATGDDFENTAGELSKTGAPL